MRKRGTNKQYVYTTPSRKAVGKVRDRVRDKTHRSTRNSDLDELLVSVNRSLQGWANYFRHGVSKATFSSVDHHAWWRLEGWIRRKHKISRKQLRHRFCLPGSWRIAHNGVVFTGASSVAVTRYRYRGATIRTPWTPAASSG
jgi:RNA-directed DNA polymerase